MIENTCIYIVINIGVIIRLSHFCERLMAHPQLWPEIAASGFKAFAVAITFECFDLIVRHELAHALLGHWAFKSGFQGEREELSLVSQALEFVADGHAALWGYALLRPKSRTPRRSILVKRQRDIGNFIAPAPTLYEITYCHCSSRSELWTKKFRARANCWPLVIRRPRFDLMLPAYISANISNVWGILKRSIN